MFAKEHIDPLIDALRDELSQYGEMLALLDQQQTTIIERRTSALLAASDAISEQGRILERVRQHREDAQRDLARSWQQADQASLGSLTQAAPQEYRPLLDALRRENNQLLVRIHQRVRQNHLLLNRAIELSEKLISSLCPGSATVYTDGGGVRMAVPLTAGIYEAVG